MLRAIASPINKIRRFSGRIAWTDDWIAAVSVLRGRLVGRNVSAEPLDLLDQEQDRPAGGLELGVRLVLGESLPPEA